MKKWNRKIGTSKREQGVATPRCPNKQIARLRKAEFEFRKMPSSGLTI